MLNICFVLFVLIMHFVYTLEVLESKKVRIYPNFI